MTAKVKREWMGDLPRRALVGVILIAVAVAALVIGGIALWLLMMSNENFTSLTS